MRGTQQPSCCSTVTAHPFTQGGCVRVHSSAGADVAAMAMQQRMLVWLDWISTRFGIACALTPYWVIFIIRALLLAATPISRPP